MIQLLLIEDDADLTCLIQKTLTDVIGGYEVRTAKDGEEGLLLLSAETPDIIITDIDMPVMDGIEMVRKIRLRNNDIPILFITGKIGYKDINLGYAAGGNMYIKKPVFPHELDAHIKGLLKGQNNQPATIYRIGKYTFDAARYYLEYNAQKQSLSKTESQLLALLCENRGNVVDRHNIVKSIWGEKVDYQSASRSLDVFINSLRHYLSQDTSVSIRTIKKVGIMLIDKYLRSVE